MEEKPKNIAIVGGGKMAGMSLALAMMSAADQMNMEMATVDKHLDHWDTDALPINGRGDTSPYAKKHKPKVLSKLKANRKASRKAQSLLNEQSGLGKRTTK